VKYLCLVCFDGAIIDTLPPGEWDQLVRDSADYDAQLQRQGHFIAAEALMPADTATTLRMRQGQAIATDGPFCRTEGTDRRLHPDRGGRPRRSQADRDQYSADADRLRRSAGRDVSRVRS